jgi:hypothetical protein
MRVTLRSTVVLLLCLILGLPLVYLALVWVAGSLAAMGDAEAAHVLGRINVGLGVLWLLSLLGLVVVLGVRAASEPDQPVNETDEPPL